MASEQERLLAHARELAAGGALDRALESFAELCAREPYNPDLWLERAGIAESAGHLDEAVATLFHVADLFAQAGMGEAAELAKRILLLDPGHSDARSFLRMFETRNAGDEVLQIIPVGDAVPEPLPPGGSTGRVASAHAPHPDSWREALPEAVDDGDSDAVPLAIPTEWTAGEAAAIPLPSVDLPSGPIRLPAALQGNRHGTAGADSGPAAVAHSVSAEVRFGRTRAPTAPPVATPSPEPSPTPSPEPSPGDEPTWTARRLSELRSPLTELLDERTRAELVRTGALHRRRRHEAIFHQGDAGASLYIILDGSVTVERQSEGTAIRRLATLQAGDFFGEMALLSGGARSATVRARSDVVLLKVARAGMRQISADNERLLALLTKFFRARLV
ncbi:MAG: cyclic nucleotide-binding domain-containing protein, partial [Myxococcota bacterium]